MKSLVQNTGVRLVAVVAALLAVVAGIVVIAAVDFLRSVRITPAPPPTPFEMAALGLEQERRTVWGRDISYAEVFGALGTPDLCKTDSTAKRFVYFYDRFGKQDWFVQITFDRNGRMHELAFGATNRFDRSGWMPFHEEADPAAPGFTDRMAGRKKVP